jgi:hypothetical protein
VSDRIVLGAIVLAFAVWATAHVTLLFGLVTRKPRGRALIALVLPPLAPYWGLHSGMPIRAWIWFLAAVVYAAARVFAL